MEHKLDEEGIYILSTNVEKGQIRLEDRKYYNVTGIAPRNWTKKGIVKGALITGSYCESAGYLSVMGVKILVPVSDNETIEQKEEIVEEITRKKK